MSYQLFKILLILEFFIIYSFGWQFLFDIDDSNKLICCSCKGHGCEQIINKDENKIICNKKTQLCWAGFVDQIPYRTCANRFCTPSDISLASEINIETCCRTDSCNSISLVHKSYKKNPLMNTTETSTSTKTTTIDYFVDEVVDVKPPISNDRELDSGEEEESASSSELRSNAKENVNYDRLSYDTDVNNGIVSISNILLCLVPLLLILLF